MSSHLPSESEQKSFRDPIPISRYLIMTFVILFAVWLAPQAARGGRMALAIVALPLIGLVAFFLFRWPAISFPLLVVAALVVPISVSTGAQSGVNISILLCIILIGLWLLDKIALKRDLRLIPEPMFIPLLLIPVVSVVSFGFGQIDWFPLDPVPLTAQIAGLALFILTPGVVLYTAHQLRDLRSLQWSTWLFLGLGGAFIITLFIPSLEDFGRRIYQRAVLDSLFWAWIAAIAFSQSLLNQKLKLPYRILFGLVGMSSFYFTLFYRQAWTSGWLPAAAALLTIIAIKKPRLALLGGAVAGVLLLAQQGLFDRIFLTGDNVYSLNTRWEAWRIMFEIIQLNPVLGLGPANYYGYTPIFSILNYNVNFSSHNNYVDIIAQIGLVGLGLFLWFIWDLAWSLWQKRDSVPEGFPRAYMYGAIGGLAAVVVSGMLGDWFLPFVYNIGLEGFRASSLAWMFLGGAVALYYIYHPEDDPGSGATSEGGRKLSGPGFDREDDTQ
jgi:O-antigen ligase